MSWIAVTCFKGKNITEKYKRYKKYKHIKAYKKQRDKEEPEGIYKILLYAHYFNGGQLSDLFDLFGVELVEQAFWCGYINVYDGILGWKDHLWNMKEYKKRKPEYFDENGNWKGKQDDK